MLIRAMHCLRCLRKTDRGLAIVRVFCAAVILLLFVAPSLIFGQGILTDVTVTPTDSTAGAGTIYSISFIASAAGGPGGIGLPPNGKIRITFPAGFINNTVSLAVNSKLAHGQYLLPVSAGQVLTLTRDNTGAGIAGLDTAIFKIAVVYNANLAKRYAFFIETLNNAGAAIDTAAADSFRIVPGPLHNVKVLDGLSGNTAEVGAVALTADQNLTVHAGAFDAAGNYRGDVPVNWSVSGGIGTLSSAVGIATILNASKTGTGLITADHVTALDDATGNITVTPGVLAKVFVVEGNSGNGQPLGARSLTTDQSLTVYAGGYDADNNYISDEPVTWTVTNGIGLLSSATGTTTTLDAKVPGVGVINADHANPAVADDATDFITVSLGNPHRVKVLNGASGATAEVNTSALTAGGTLQVHASSYDADDNRIGDVSVNWIVSGNIGALSVATGTTTTLTAQTAGVGVITADHATLIDDATGNITVSAGPLAKVLIVEGATGPGLEMGAKNVNTDQSLELHAAGYDAFNNYVGDQVVTWSVSNSIGTLAPVSGTSAILSLTQPGSGTIFADHLSVSVSDDFSGTITVSGGAAVRVKVLTGASGNTGEVGPQSFTPGNTLTVHASSFDGDGNYIGDVAVAWSVSGGIGTLSPASGVSTTFTTTTVGSGIITADETALIDGFTGTITVTAGALSFVKVVEGISGNGPELMTRTLTTDQTLPVHAAGYDAGGNYLGDFSVNWSLVSGSLGTLSTAVGTATTLDARTPGTAQIRADHTNPAVTDDNTGNITVSLGNAHHVKVLSGASGATAEVTSPPPLTAGTPFTVHASSFDADDNRIGDVTVNWTVSGGIGILIPSTGTSTTLNTTTVGSGVITADHATLIDDATGTITVTAGLLNYVKVVEGAGGNGPELSNKNLTTDNSLIVHAAGYDVNGNYITDVIVNWSVSGSIGAISPASGVSATLTLTTPGSGIITADHASASDDGSGTISVTVGAPHHIKVLSGASGSTAEEGSSSLQVGNNLTVHASSFDADDNYIGDVSVTWSVSGGIGNLSSALNTTTTLTAQTVGSGTIFGDHTTLLDDATGTITVTPGALAKVRIVEGESGNGPELGNRIVTTDQSILVHAAGYDASDNYLGDQPVTWSVSGNIGTLSPASGTSTTLTLTTAGSGIITADHATATDDVSGTIAVNVGAPQNVKVLAGANGNTSPVGAQSLTTGATLQVHASSFDGDNNYIGEVSVAWSLSSNIGTLNPVSGINTTFTANAVGTGIITADHASLIDGASGLITVGAGSLGFIKIVEGTSGNGPELGDYNMTADQTLVVHAAGYDGSGNYIGDQTVTWSVSNGIGTLSTTLGTSTILNATTPGVGIIAADASGSITDDVSGNITVTAGAPSRVKVLNGLSGNTAEVGNVTLTAGQTLPVHAGSFDTDNNYLNDVSVSWLLSAGIGTLNPTSGVSTTLTATTAGSGIITADHATLIDDGTGTITVVTGTLSYIKIIEGPSGNNAELGAKNLSTDQTLTVHAAGYDANGNYLGDQSVAWTVTNGIGTFSAATGISTNFDPKTPGTGFIIADHAAAIDDTTGTITVTVGAPHRVKILANANGATAEVGAVSLNTGQTLLVHAGSFDADGNYIADVSVDWSLSAAIGTLSPASGISTTLTATTVGAGVIAADHSSLIDDVTGTITVTAGNLSYVKILDGPAGNTAEVGNISLTTNETRTLHAAGFDANNNYLGDQPVTWSVSGSIGTLSTTTGTSTTFDARTPGTGFITADHLTATDDNTGTITVAVGLAHHVKILSGATGPGVEVTNQTLQTGNQFTMHASSFDADDNRIGDVTVNWSVSGNIGTLAPASGISTTFTATTVGSGVVAADHATLIDDATGTFVVNSGSLSFVRIVEGTSGNGLELGNFSLSTDQTLKVHAAGYDVSGNYLGDQAVTWTVSGGIGTLSPASGTFTVLDARTPGSGIITADHATAADDNSGTITVTPGSQHHVKILSGASGPAAEVTTQTLQTGGTFTMHASSFDADDNRLGDVSVNWSVSGGIGTLAPLAGISTTFTATTVGSGIITADHAALIDDATGTFVVNSGTLSYIKIVGGPSGNSPEVGDESLTADGTLTVHAAGFDANNNYLGDQAVTWSLSGGIGMLSTTSGTATTLDAKVPGTGVISADHATATDDVTGTITVTPGAPHHIKVLGTVSGNTPEVTNVPLTTGQTLDVHASSFDADDNYRADVSVTWSLSSPIGTLTPASGVSTTLTATTVGSATLLADHPTLIDDATGVITVTAGNLSYVKIVEGPGGNGPELDTKNLTTDETLPVHAAGYDANNNYLGDFAVDWSVTGGIGAVNPLTGAAATLTLTRPGIGRIRADHVSATDDETGDLTVAVGALHHVKVLAGNNGNNAPVGNTSLNADQTLIVHAGGFDADDNYLNDFSVNWSVSGGIGTLNPATGISTTLTARKVGVGVITADHASALDGQSGSITVTIGALSFIKVLEGQTGGGTELGAKTITVDDVLQLHAAGFDADSNYAGDQPANWSSAGNLTPVVSGTNVTGLSFAPTLAPATGTIRATHATAGFDDTGLITVNDGALRKIKILSGPNNETTEVGATTLASGQTLEVHAAGFDADDNYITDLSANWSMVGAIGTVAPPSGISTTFTASASGSGSIRATAAGNLEDVAGPITVIPGGVAKIVLRTAPNGGGTPLNNLNMTADQDAIVYAAGYDAGNTFLGDVNVTWTSTNNLTPAVSATGSSVTFAPTLANADGSVNGQIIGTYSPTIKDSTGTITVLPGNPSGTINFTATPAGLPSNGTSTSTITTSGTIKDADGNNVGAGKRFTVTLAPGNLGTITTPDLDPGTPDVQMETDASSQLNFVFRAGTTGGIVIVNVISGSGANGSTQISLGSISILSVTTSPATVSRGQTGISVSMLAQNVSSAPLTEVTAGLTFAGSADRTGEYSVTPSAGNPTTLAGNSTGTFSFIVNVAANATLETVTLNGTVAGKVNGTPVSTSNANQTDSWTVQLAAVLNVVSVTTAPDTVAQGQTGIEVRVRVANNLGQPNSANAVIDSVRLIFKQGALIKTSEYIIGLPTPQSGASIAGNSEAEYTFLVNVGSAATLGLITIEARAHGKEGNSNLSLADLNAGAPDNWRVIEGNVFSIVTITPSQSTVTASMTKPWQVRMELNNAGSSPIQLNLAPDKTFIRFTIGNQNVTSQYGIASPTALDEGGTVLTAGNSGHLTFGITPTGSTLGTATISGSAEGRDQAGQTVTDNTNDFGTGAVTVQSPGTMKIDRIDVSPSPVTANRGKDWIITATVTNEGESSVRLDSMNVTAGNNIGYIFIKPSTFKDGTSALGSRETKLLEIVVDQTGSQTGTSLPITMTLKGTETNSGRVVASTGVNGSITVQSQAVLEITAVTPSRPSVTTNQTAAWNVTVVVRNNGGSQVTVKSDSSTNLRFRIGAFQSGYSVALLSAPTIGAGGTANLIFQISTTGANPGTAALVVKVAATETNSDAEVIDTDNSSSVLMQSPPNVTYIANSMLPDIVNINTFYAFTMRVQNIAGASTVALNPANTRFRFSGGPANFVAALDANFVQSIASGDTTLTFVSTPIPANMPIGTYTPVVELRGTENGNPFSRDLSVTPNELQVTRPADVQIVSVQPGQSTVTAGMTKAWNVVVRVANNGGFQAKLDSVGLQLSNGIDRKSEYNITYPTQFLGSVSTFLDAGVTDSLRFVFNSTGSTTGPIALQTTLFMKDQSSGQKIIPPPAGNSSFVVQSPAVIKVTNIATSQLTVTANRTKDWTITATVTNEGGSAIRLHPVLDSLKVTIGNNLGYRYAKLATFTDGSNLLGGVQTKTLAITVDQTGSQTGTVPIRVDLKGFETNSDRLVASTGVSGSINVQSQADLEILSVTPSRQTVTINQNTAWTVTAAVRNNGGSQVVVRNDTASTNLRFRIAPQFQNGYVWTLQSAPTIGAGATANVIFRVTTTGPNPGTAELWVKVAATETNSDTTLASTDNSTSVLVQSPPSVNYIANSMQPDIANIGTFYTFTVRVNNAAGAATVALNPAATTFRFNGGPATFTATLDANPGKVQSIASGDTTLTFVSTQIPADMPEGTYTPVVELRGTENGNAFSQNLSVTLDELQITRPADVQIVSVQPSQSTVTAGMTKAWNATLLVTNNGGFQFQLDSLSLKLINGIDRKTEYDIVYPAQFIKAGSPFLEAGETDTLRLIFNRTGSTTGPTALSVFVHGKDPSNGQLVTSQEGNTSFLVQSPGALKINSITPSQPTVTRNQTQQWHVDMSVTNPGQSEVGINFNNSVTGIILGFGAGYTIQPPATFLSGGTRLRGDSTGVLRFLITQTGSQTGLNTINSRIAGTELNSNDPRSDDTSDNGSGAVLVQAPAQLRLETVRVIGAPNARFVNLLQPFVVRLVVRNLGEETADEVRVQVATNGGSQIIPAAGDTAGNIGGGLTKAVTFSITAANTENLLGEVFRGLIIGATAHNTGTSITPQTALDDTAVVIIQRPANLVIDKVAASRDTVSAGQTDDWFIYAVVRNSGTATMTFNTPDRSNLRIEIDGAQQTDYGIDVDPSLLQNGNLTLTGGESDTLRFTVTSTGLRGGGGSLIASLAGVDRNDIKPVSRQGMGQVYVRTTATVRLVRTDPVVLRPLINGTAFVNVDQVFGVKLTVENTGFEEVKEVVVRLQTDGSSRILTPEQTIPAIAARARQEISFQVEADTGTVAGTPPEIFAARVVSALTVQGNQPANILTPLDSTAQVVVQRPARLAAAASIQDNNPILSTNQSFTFSALVTNSGQAPVDGSGLVRFIHPPDFTVTGAEERSFTVGQLVTWQVRAPLTPVNAADLIVRITKAAVDSNRQALAVLGKDADTLTVQVFRADLRIVRLEITAPAGAKDRTLSTEQEFNFTAQLSSTVVSNGEIELRVPPGYNIAPGPPPAFGEFVTWKVQATATANSIPVYLVVTARGNDGNGNPISPVTDSLSVTTMNKTNLSLITGISDPPGARDGVVARGRQFTVTARVLNDGDAGVDGKARLRIEYDPSQGFSTVEAAEKDVTVGSSEQWIFTAPNSSASDIFTIRYTPTGVPADTNSNVRAAQTETLERLSVRTDSVNSELRIVSFRIIAPFGATDNGLSTGQQFTVRAQVLGIRAAQVTVKLTEPLGFTTNDNTQQVFTTLDEQRDVNWTFQAPLASRLDSMVVTVSGNDVNDNSLALPTVRRSFSLSVVEQARLAVSGEITSPLSARADGIVTRNQLFTVTARLLNRGAASLSAGSRAQIELTLPRDSSIPLADDYSTTSSLQQEITDFINGVATWEIKARNLASTQIDNIRVRLLQPYPKDENTDNTATIEDVEALIPIQTESKTLVVQMLPHPSAGPVAQGEKSSLMMRLKLTNQGNLNSTNILLRMFTLHVRDRNGAPLNANSAIKALRVVDTRRPAQVLSSLTSISAADSLKISFVPADTLLGGVPDSVDVVVDIADNTATGSAFRLTFMKEADVDAIDESSPDPVEIIFLDERGNSITVAQVTSRYRAISDTDFQKAFYNYPNPFDPQEVTGDRPQGGTYFNYGLTQASDIEFRIYTLLGELVYVKSFKSTDPEGQPLPDGGFRSLFWDGRNGKGKHVLNGVYIAMLKTNAGLATTKVAVLKR